MSKPSIPQGTRDFSPAEVRRRQYIFNTLRGIFENYGFQPLETPSMENLTTLMGKYGEEGDRLIFKILNNGLHEKKEADKEKLNAEWNKVLDKSYSTPVVTERALRYDLTIPFARYVVMHQNELAFPFRRYQMQPVWRADRPQKGRYREFWQCDADVVGSTSLINEAELLCIYQSAFHQLGLPQVVIKVNSRKLLAGIAEVCGIKDRMIEMTVILDKLDKIGWNGVFDEFANKQFPPYAITKLSNIVNVAQDDLHILPYRNDYEKAIKRLVNLSELFADSVEGRDGLGELSEIFTYYNDLASQNDWNARIEFDITLARGLNYYTGFIVEVVCNAVKMGSIGGGGRYDDLTGLFGLKGLSGVGVSFGIDRIYDVIEELNLFPTGLATGTKVLLLNFGGANEQYALRVLQHLRNAGIAAEIYPDAARFDKQMKYANKRGVPYVILPGDEEREKQMVSLKNFTTGEQQLIPVQECINKLKD